MMKEELNDAARTKEGEPNSTTMAKCWSLH
jgi:hypothetical protein